MAGALDGIRVIDFGQYLAGPLVALLLADNGADVIRVDPPGGPRWKHHANAILQRGKRSIVLDLKQPEDQAIARRLVESADVVVENFRPGVMERLGLGPEAMTAANPRLVYCTIPGFGSDDPRAGVAAIEGVVEAAVGLYLPSTWDPDPNGEPVFNVLPLSSNFAAFRAAQCITAALIARERLGRGQQIEVPLFDASFELVGDRGTRIPGVTPRERTRIRHNFILDSQFECADGRFVNLSWLESRQISSFANRFGSPDWAQEGLLDEDRLRADASVVDDLRKRLSAVFKTRTAAEWARIANPGADLGNCQTTAEWLHEDEHARTSRSVISLNDPELGATEQAGYPFKLSKTPPEAQGPRHMLDADRAAILAELAAHPTLPPTADTSSSDATLARALEGFRVVDVTQILAGPTCGRILAEFGADVVKINNPYWKPVNNYHYVNTGKRTMLVDLKSPEGMAIFWQLIERADVLSMNFSPPAAERLGITDAQVRQHRPEIVYSSISCYGWDGPRGEHRGHEQLGQAVTGIQVRWGQGFREPIMQSYPICDLGTGNLAAVGILFSLYHRLRTGEGQFVGTSLSQTGTYQQIPFMIDYAGRVWDEPGGQHAKGYGSLDRLHKGSDRWFYLAAVGPNALRRLAAVEGLEGMDRLAEQDLAAALAKRFAAEPAETWVARLGAAKFGAHVLRTVQENMEDALVKQRGLSVERDYPALGRVRTVGPSGRLSLTPIRLNYAAPPPGADNQAVLDEIGFGPRYEKFVQKGVVNDHVGPRDAVAV